MFRKVAQLPLDYSLFKGRDTVFNWSPSGAIIFGNGSVKQLGEEVKRLGGKKVVVCTDAGLVKCGIAKKVTDSLDEAGISYLLFDKCEANPSVEIVEAVVELAKDADILIGLGGGSSIDPAKAASILLTNGGDIRDYEGCDVFQITPIPVIAIPTAAGTGAETTPFAVITDVQKQWKMPIGGSFNIASLVICDPELTASLPPMITATTGMDALTHAIEGYVSRSLDPISEPIIEKAIKLMVGAIRRATYKGEHDKDARYDMMLGSMLAGMGFTNTILGIAHSMAHPLGAMFHVPHGVGNAICLPVVMQFNRVANPERLASIATLFGKDTSGLDVMEAAQIGVDCVFELLEDLPVPPLSKWGVKESDIDALAEEAMKGGDRWTNPRETTIEDFKNLYLQCLELKNN